ncbi:MAG: CDP-2,3-bis-(O-geranylgeranyl)-sn-glycerol synthase [Asgard group archaeon]|nr:CDP-2,3-bis-(O-geranylgeranyl)-sn-glycerol synthase [Asgard group archaeon]
MLPTWFEIFPGSEIFNAIFFILPTLLSNMTPLLFGGGVPMDFRGYWFDDKRILGDHKTIRGFIAGFMGGFLIGIFSWWWLTNIIEVAYPIPLVNGFFQGIGTGVGDCVGSFIKRRLNIQPGGSLIVMDQIGFMFFGLLFGRIGTPYPWIYWLILIPIAFIVHFAANAVGYLLGLKDVWW